MKYTIRNILLLSLILNFSCDPTEMEKQAKKVKKSSIESMYEAIEKIDWEDREAPPAGNQDANKPCFPDLMNMIDAAPDLEPEEMDEKDIYVTYRFSIELQKLLKDHKFDEIDGSGIDILPDNSRDRIIKKLDKGFEDKEFVSEVRGEKGKMSVADSIALTEFYELYNDTIVKTGRYIANFSEEKGNCLIVQQLGVKFKEVRPTEQSVAYTVMRRFLFYCRCEEDEDPTKVKNAIVELESTILGNYERGGLFDLVFSEPSKPKVSRLELVCCDQVEEENDGHNQQSEEDEQQGH